MTEQKSFERSAPRPLSVYLGAAMGLIGPDATAEDIESHKKSVARMLQGIRKYQDHHYRRPVSTGDLFWQEGGTTLTRFAPGETAAHNGALLLVPSMVNGSEILDLLPDRSFARWLAGQGFDVYLLDWGNPPADDGLQTLDGGVVPRLLAAAEAITKTQEERVNALGYCMGGTLLLAAAAGNPTLFGKLALLSAPWDFHAGNPKMLTQIMAGAASALQLLEQKSALPVDWIQNVFAHVNPALAIHKFSAFLEMEAGSAEEQIFIAVEDWLNSGQDLPGGVARSCILDWYSANKPAKGEWVDLGRLENHPILVVAAGKDILVPPESAIAVAQQLPHATLLEPPCGHISLMAGKQAKAQIWEPLHDWLISTP